MLPDTVDLALPPLGGVEVVTYSAGEGPPAAHADAEVLVAWGNWSAGLRRAARSLPALRWVQTLSAGADSVLAAGFDPAVTITTGRGLHDATVAEHTLALMLAAVRRLHEMRDAQRERAWAAHLGGVQVEGGEGPVRTLHGARVLIWGFGSIAATLAPHLLALGAEVTGVARHSGNREGVPVHDEAELDALLPETDMLVLLLPSTPQTVGALDGARLALLPRRAWVVNTGRGTTIDQVALARAIEGGRLAGAALDVFEEEPLPRGSRLWDLPNVIVSPHAAGGRPRGADELLVRQLRRYRAGEPLENVLDRERGY